MRKSYNYKNNDTIPLIDIPKWDFHWQGYYTYQRLLKIEGNSTFFGEASYDNTSNNPDNPNFPPQDVSAGENTTEEMMVTFITYTDYQAGDENIILDSTLLATPVTQGMKGKLLVFPNPARTVMYLTAQDIPDLSPVKLSLSDMNGRLIKEENWNTSQKYHTISIESLPSGIYLLRAETEQGAFVHKIIKE
ncbi:MAG: T9SS type A sorting domain-containing protein [Bacteroidia bacterium]|nr:T9SS type A sorting domain-containing protein [Bacteroidia bacterium]